MGLCLKYIQSLTTRHKNENEKKDSQSANQTLILHLSEPVWSI